MKRRYILALSLLLAAGALACEDPTRPANGAMRFTEVDVGRAHSCAIDADGRVFCWGSMFYRPVQMGLEQPAAELLADGTCALTDGSIRCWEMAAERLDPTPIEPDLGWIDYDRSFYQCGVAADKNAYCWYANEAPRQVIGDQTWQAIDLRGSTVCAVATNREGYCWGENSSGQLGVGDSIDRSEPTLIAGGHEWQDIRVGNDFACGLATDGVVYCWGNNLSGQLGRFMLAGAPSPVPVAVDMQFDFITLSVGGHHACAIEVGGVLRCWGSDRYGGTGTGEGADVHTPTRVGPTLRFSDVAAGQAHTCGTTLDGDVYCWGDNESLQLGDRTEEDHATPVQVIFDPAFEGAE